MKGLTGTRGRTKGTLRVFTLPVRKESQFAKLSSRGGVKAMAIQYGALGILVSSTYVGAAGGTTIIMAMEAGAQKDRSRERQRRKGTGVEGEMKAITCQKGKGLSRLL